MRDISEIIKTSIEDDVVYPFYAVEMFFDSGRIGVWTGVGSLVANGLSYAGVGNLLKVSTIEETSEISPRGANVSLSGIDETILTNAFQEPYQGRKAKIYFGTFAKGYLKKEDDFYILLENGSRILLDSSRTGLTEIFSGYMDQMSIDESPEEPTISLSIENKLIDLERPRVRKYSSAYQKSKYPGDKGFDYVEVIQDKQIRWG